MARRRAAFPLDQHPGSTKEDAKALLEHLHDLDQYVRKALMTWAYDHGYGGSEGAQKFKEALLSRMSRLDGENTRILKGLLERWGWFTRSVWGEEVDGNAWTLVQHADDDLPFQKRVLGMLEPLLATKETSSSRFALLFDRVAVNEGRRQRYGTQGYCVGEGTWTPRAMEDPEHVDARREAVGLQPMAEYVKVFKNICHEDQTAQALKAHPLKPQ